MLNLNKQQPDPISNNDGIAVWPVVIREVQYLDDTHGTLTMVQADMNERNAEGVARYGVPLTTNNGRNPLIDAYQEVLDAIVYTRQALFERQAPGVNQRPLAEAYADMLETALALRKLIHEQAEV